MMVTSSCVYSSVSVLLTGVLWGFRLIFTVSSIVPPSSTVPVAGFILLTSTVGSL